MVPGSRDMANASSLLTLTTQTLYDVLLTLNPGFKLEGGLTPLIKTWTPLIKTWTPPK